MEELSGLYTELEDYRGMVQLFEDQILRGRDKETRVDLARKVALLWRDELDDPRETADAWRRVLRMKPGDDEATEGLAVAKQLDLHRKSLRPPGPNLAAAPPKPAVEDEPEEAEGDTEAARLDSAESESDAAGADADADEGDTDDDGYSADAQEPEPTSEPPSLEALDSVRSGIAEDERDDDASDDDANHDDASHDDASHDGASHDDASHDDELSDEGPDGALDEDSPVDDSDEDDAATNAAIDAAPQDEDDADEAQALADEQQDDDDDDDSEDVGDLLDGDDDSDDDSDDEDIDVDQELAASSGSPLRGSVPPPPPSSKAPESAELSEDVDFVADDELLEDEK
jgi:hypothetical protein